MKFRKEFFLVVALVALVGVAATQLNSAPRTDKPKLVHQEEFFVVGIEARTTAAKEMSSEGVIPQLWQKFMQEGVFHKIPNKADENTYAVYTDFTDKRYGEYSVVIGVRVADKSQVPPGLVLKVIPAGRYLVFLSDQGPAPNVVPAAWQKVADSEDRGTLGYTRSYKADYEVYGDQAMDPQNLRAELHVGVK